MKVKILVFGLIVLACGGIWYLWHPTCVVETQEDLDYIKQNNYTPLEQRTDRAWGIKVWQKKQDQWYQCKPFLDRFFFS